MAQRDLPASHYLKIYRLKLAAAEFGVTNSSMAGVQFMRQLVDALNSVDPDTPIKLEASEREGAVFTTAVTGALLARLQFGDI